MKLLSVHSHTLAGILYFDLPLAIMLYLAFENIVRVPLTNNLPIALKERLNIYSYNEESRRISKRWYIILASLLVGIASHLFWDSFTHRNGFFVQRLSWLAKTFDWNGTEIPMFKIAQHGSTSVGLVLLILVIAGMKKHPAKSMSAAKGYWLITILAALTVITIRFILSRTDFTLGNLIATSIAGLFLGIIVSSIVSSYHKPK